MKKGIFIAFCLSLVFNQSCKPDDPFTGDCFIPNAGVNITINMNLPEYFNLQNLGEHVVVEDQGNRGVYIIHNYDDLYYAVERTCPYESTVDCAQVTIDYTILRLKCGQVENDSFIACCGSEYDFNSTFLSGPTRCNLKTYRVAKNGNQLFVSN